MNDDDIDQPPAVLEAIHRETDRLGFAMASEPKTGALLRALAASKPAVGGIYLVDDLLPQPNWPEGHAPKVPALVSDLESRGGFASVKLAWASGLMLLVRTNAA